MAKRKPKAIRERVPPSEIEAEMHVLGTIMYNETAEAAGPTCAQLEPEQFYRTTHRHIFVAMQKLVQRGEPVLPWNVEREIDDLSVIHAKDAHTYLIDLPNYCTFAGLDCHIAAIRVAYTKRRLITSATRLLVDIEDGMDANDALARLNASITQIASGSASSLKDMASLMDEMMILTEPQVFESGFHELDATYGGVPRGVTVLTGPTGSGKTTMQIQLGVRAAKAGYKGLWFMGDMHHTRVGEYLMCAEGRVTKGVLLDVANIDTKAKIAAELANLDVKRYEGEFTLPKIEMMIRAQASQGVTWVLLDSLQMVEVPGVRDEWHGAEKTARKMQALARELGLYILCTLEFKKKDTAFHQRKDMKARLPTWNDCKGGSGVAHACDLFVICWPPHLNDSRDHWLVIDKSRDGPTPRKFNVQFVGEEHRFADFPRP